MQTYFGAIGSNSAGFWDRLNPKNDRFPMSIGSNSAGFIRQNPINLIVLGVMVHGITVFFPKLNHFLVFVRFNNNLKLSN